MRVGVLRGGPSGEYEVSLKTGATVLGNLSERYEPHDIFIDRSGVWHYGGVPQTPHDALRRVDIVFNALHGEYGEDGKVQRILEQFAMPYTGSTSLASAVAMNKAMTKESLASARIRMAPHLVLDRNDASVADHSVRVFRSFPQPSVVKPLALGSSIGVSIARDFESLKQAMTQAFAVSGKILVEEFISGREATCGVVDDFRGESTYALLPIEITPPAQNQFYDYEAKYQSDDTNYVCPGNFSDEEKAEIQRSAVAAHRGLNLRHYSRADFIVNPRRGVYFLEVNTLPGMTSHSLIPKSLAAVGCPLPDFLDHVLALAWEHR